MDVNAKIVSSLLINLESSVNDRIKIRNEVEASIGNLNRDSH
jgi:hypothetical protein